MCPVVLADVEYAAVTVTRRTRWVFAILRDGEGAEATVELTHGPHTESVLSLFGEAVSRLVGTPLETEEDLSAILGLSPSALDSVPALATAVSGLRSAYWILSAQARGESLAVRLGAQRQPDSVELYANVNRSLLDDRGPAAFARAAALAVEAGFRTVKCAPFDEVEWPNDPESFAEKVRPGLERVAAVRRAIGPDVALLVDCHSRLGEETAPVVARRLEEHAVGWFEEPLSPLANAEALARVARRVSIPIAGGENGYGADTFRRLVEMGAVTIVMPDVKHCGGPWEAVRAAQEVRPLGGRFSLHSPSGPISQLISGHVTAAVPGAMPLEHAVAEADWRAELLDPPERIEGGRLWIPEGPGLGASLNLDVLVRMGGERWR